MGESYSYGDRASRGKPSSVVRVYERDDISDRIFYTCAWIKTSSGRPVERVLPEGTTWEAAKLFAELASGERKRAILAGRNEFGEEITEPVTIERLFREYLASEDAASWSKRHAADVKASIKFWRRHLDTEGLVVGGSLSPALVERIAGREARKHARGVGPRWVRKRLANLRAAVLWGMNKAHLYEVNPLRGLSFPEYEPETDELIYSEEETRLLWTPDPRIDWRVTLLVNIAADTGSRLRAMLSLLAEDIVTDGDRVYLRFRKEYDKRNKTALVPVSQPTTELLADALERDVVAEWGWLFPEGRLDHDDPRDKPWGESAAIHALHDAEKILGIPYIRKRGYHGQKRRHVTTSMEVAHGDTELVGDVTRNASAELLRRIYRKANRSRTATHVDSVRRALEGSESARESTRSGEAE